MLSALGFMLGPTREIVIAGDPAMETLQAMVNTVQGRFMPNKVLLLRPAGDKGERIVAVSPFVRDMVPLNSDPTAYVCEKYACQTPVTEVNALDALLE
jgi:uncharacterized protein YyaL (SSP411 family)